MAHPLSLKAGTNLRLQQQIALPATQLQSIQRSLLHRSIRQPVAAEALVLCVNNAQPYFEADGPLRPPGQPPFSSDDPSSSNRQPEKPLVRVRLSVHYRVHSRQMLCIGGSQIPFGWSFLSIAKVPMTWNQGDVWTCELLLPAGQRVEYKYVILEEQDWTKLENEDSEGLVEVTYRSGSEPGRPPDIQVIQKKMAIVAWQPGPNRVVAVPTEDELAGLKAGQLIERVPARASTRSLSEAAAAPKRPDPYEGTWETLSLEEDGQPLLDRHDVWGWSPGSSSRPAGMKGFRFDS